MSSNHLQKINVCTFDGEGPADLVAVSLVPYLMFVCRVAGLLLGGGRQKCLVTGAGADWQSSQNRGTSKMVVLLVASLSTNLKQIP